MYLNKKKAIIWIGQMKHKLSLLNPKKNNILFLPNKTFCIYYEDNKILWRSTTSVPPNGLVGRYRYQFCAFRVPCHIPHLENICINESFKNKLVLFTSPSSPSCVSITDRIPKSHILTLPSADPLANCCLLILGLAATVKIQLEWPVKIDASWPCSTSYTWIHLSSHPLIKVRLSEAKVNVRTAIVWSIHVHVSTAVIWEPKHPLTWKCMCQLTCLSVVYIDATIISTCSQELTIWALIRLSAHSIMQEHGWLT